MGVGVEALFTSAPGMQILWVVEDVKLDTGKRHIDSEIGCQGQTLVCPACKAAAQPVHDRPRRSGRHLDFLQFEALLHCDVPRIACGGCGKTTQMPVPWAHPGSGFTAAFEALALALCRELAMEAMDQVRRTQMREVVQAVRSAIGSNDRKTVKQFIWGLRRNPSSWSAKQIDAMHWLQRCTLKRARAWRLKMALPEVYARAKAHAVQASTDLRAWLSWSRRCGLEPFKKLATTLKDRFDAVVRGITDHRSNAFVEAMN